jgi:hypothetical protein
MGRLIVSGEIAKKYLIIEVDDRAFMVVLQFR